MTRAAAACITLLWILESSGAAATTSLTRCIEAQKLPRVGRVIASDGRPSYLKIAAARDGSPTAVIPLRGASTLAEALNAAADTNGEIWTIDDLNRICSPVDLDQRRIEAEDIVVVAAGLNYAAHAEEAGGGDIFVFPKPVAPSSPYGEVPKHAGVELLDYEVELAFVLLDDLALDDIPDRQTLLQRTAFFVANDVTDREPIILEKALSGPGTGFVKGKGRRGYLPAGPWAVRGSDLYAALDACGAEGLGIHLEVDEGNGFVERQSSNTARMILDPRELIARIASQVIKSGRRTAMPVERDGTPRYFPLAAGANGRVLPAGSIILTGTPDGIALRAPAVLPLLLRGVAAMQGPLAQFRDEELARARSGSEGGYLASGDIVRAAIDGLGTQRFAIAADAHVAHPCGSSDGAAAP